MKSVNPLKPSERMKLPRQQAAEQSPDERNHNFLEVSFGFDVDRTIIESQRCIECKEPLCMDGCPVGIDIPKFIELILLKDYVGAVRKIREANYLPAICGRVCPQETQCEELCVIGKKLTPVASLIAADAIAARVRDPIRVWSLQEIHAKTVA